MDEALINPIFASKLFKQLSKADRFALEITCRNGRFSAFNHWRSVRSYSIAVLFNDYKLYRKIVGTVENDEATKSVQNRSLENKLGKATAWLHRRSPYIQELKFDAPEFLEVRGAFATILSRFEFVHGLTIAINSAHLWCGSQDFRSITRLLTIFGSNLKSLEIVYDPRVNFVHSLNEDDVRSRLFLDTEDPEEVEENNPESLWDVWNNLYSIESLSFQNVSMCDLLLASHLPNKQFLLNFEISASKCPRKCCDQRLVSDMLQRFETLENLHIRMPAIPTASKFGNLKSLSITIGDSFWLCQDLSQLLRTSGKSIMELDIRFSDCRDLESEVKSVMKLIASSIISLRSLSIVANSDGVLLKWLKTLANCRKLEKLEVLCLFLVPQIDLSIFHEFKALQILKIKTCIPKEVCLKPLKAIPKLKKAELWIQSHSDKLTFERHAQEISECEADVRLKFRYDIFDAFPCLRSYRRLSPME